jgi:hypothetical protein
MHDTPRRTSLKTRPESGMTTDRQDEREAFAKWRRDEMPNLAGTHAKVAWDAWQARAAIHRRPSPAPAETKEPLMCECHRCIREQDIRTAEGLPISASRMILCPICGNKRCPHASDHELACTGSNAPGQPGSVYAAPQPPAAPKYAGIAEHMGAVSQPPAAASPSAGSVPLLTASMAKDMLFPYRCNIILTDAEKAALLALSEGRAVVVASAVDSGSERGPSK